MPEYISKEVAIEVIQNAHCDYPTWPHIVEAKERMTKALNAIPAAAVAGVVHGEWAFTNAGWKCSLCGHSMPYWPMASTQEETNYCPNCGAKMDKEDET